MRELSLEDIEFVKSEVPFGISGGESVPNGGSGESGGNPGWGE